LNDQGHFSSGARKALKRITQVTLAVILAFGAPAAQAAYTISIGSPTLGSPWTAGSGTTLSCSGDMTWFWTANPPPMPDIRPTTGIVYLHAGGNGGPVTNSAFMTISNIQNGSQDWTASMALTPTTPPTYGGAPGSGPYTVEADAQVAGGAVATTFVQITVIGG
jgi:hypothetical protein